MIFLEWGWKIFLGLEMFYHVFSVVCNTKRTIEFIPSWILFPGKFGPGFFLEILEASLKIKRSLPKTLTKLNILSLSTVQHFWALVMTEDKASHHENNTPLNPTFILQNWGMQGYTYFSYFCSKT